MRQALLDMGLDSATLQRLGIRVLHLGLIYPLNTDIVRRFAAGLEDIIVVEEKRAFVESRSADSLYALSHHPRVLGKYDEHEALLFPMHGEFDADVIVERLGPRLQRLVRRPGIAARLATLQAIRGRHYDPFMPASPITALGARTAARRVHWRGRSSAAALAAMG